MRTPQLPLLVFCLCLLPAPRAAADASSSTQARSSTTGRRLGPSGNRFGGSVAMLRRDSSQISGDATRRVASGPAKAGAKGEAKVVGEEKVKSAASSVDALVQTHRIVRGETIDQIAARYNTSETSLRALNGLSSDESTRAGQILFVPSQDKTAAARGVLGNAVSNSPASKNAAWRRYAKSPKEKGHIDLSTYTTRFVGSVVEKDGTLRPAAVRAIGDILGAGGKHPPAPERLIRLLVKVSDTFGGRPIRVVSGYRTASYYQDSRHRLSAAVDFGMVDVPNVILCEYLRELEDVGVGYYPNSSFVHLDVRKQSAYWVDYAGPGEPPRSTPRPTRPTHGSKRWLLAELDAMVHRSQKALEHATAEPSAELPTPVAPSLEPHAPESVDPPASSEPVAAAPELSEPISL